jgi:hypothetical protein
MHRGGLCGRPLRAGRLGWQRTATAGQRGVASGSALNGSVIRRPPPSFPLHFAVLRSAIPLASLAPRTRQGLAGSWQPSACVSQLFDSVPFFALSFEGRLRAGELSLTGLGRCLIPSLGRWSRRLRSASMLRSLPPGAAVVARARLTSRLVANLCRLLEGLQRRFNSSPLITSSAGFVSRNPKVRRAAVDDVVKFLARYLPCRCVVAIQRTVTPRTAPS